MAYVLPMTTTAALHAAARMLAGSDFMWTHPDAPSTLDSSHRRGLTILLAEAQGGLCAACGEELAGERFDLCHIVASRKTERGVMPGNVYVGHTACNSDDDKVFAINGGIVPLASLVRADLVQTAHPTRRVCLATDAAVKARREARRQARMARM